MESLEERAIVITGASSGIGRALAERFARRKGAVLGLLGRDAGRLEAAAQDCRAMGATVETGQVDTRDRAAMAAWLDGFAAAHGLDMVVANAGVSAGALPGGHPEKGEQVYDIFEINLGGALNLVVPALSLMEARRRGRIVLISSLSAYAPLPGGAAYSGSKAALLTFGLALRESLKASGVRVNVVVPGFITTPMSASFRGWKPFEMPASEAAARIERGLAADRRTIVFPLSLALLCRVGSLVPEWLSAPVMAKFRL